MSEIEQLTAIRAQTLTLLGQARMSPKPSYSIDGQSVDWERYVAGLERTVAWCTAQLQALQPFEVETQAYT